LSNSARGHIRARDFQAASLVHGKRTHQGT
jgi:hypothetical protein